MCTWVSQMIIQNNYDIKHPKCIPKTEMFHQVFKLRFNLATMQKSQLSHLLEPQFQPPTNHCDIKRRGKKSLLHFYNFFFSFLEATSPSLFACVAEPLSPVGSWNPKPQRWGITEFLISQVCKWEGLRVRCEALLKVNASCLITAPFLFLALLAVKIKI